MTEEEARQKSCPMRLDVNTTYGKCVGSECMAWVWDIHPARADEYNPRGQGHCGMVK